MSLFSIEYVVRIAHGKFKYARSFFGVDSCSVGVANPSSTIKLSSAPSLETVQVTLSIQSIEIRQSLCKSGFTLYF